MICEEQEILAFLDLATTASDHDRTMVAVLQPAVEQLVKEFLGYSVEQAAHTLFLPLTDSQIEVGPLSEIATGIPDYEVSGGVAYPQGVSGPKESMDLWSPEVPIRSVASLYSDSGAYAGSGDSDFAAGSLLTEGTNFWVDWDKSGICRSGRIVRIGSAWPRRKGTVQVTLTAGYTAVELTTGIASGIKLAVLNAVRDEFRAEGGGDVQSMRLGDYAVTMQERHGTEGLSRKVKRQLRSYVRYSRFV